MRKSATTPAKNNASHLRKRMTKPEVFLWTIFRTWRESGIVIRRQHSIGPYIVDFLCEKARLVIEVDGRSHDKNEIEPDQIREEFIRSQGYKIVRVSNDDALFHTEQVAQNVWELVRS